MNTNDAAIKLQKFFLESADQTTSDIASCREEIVKDVNELLGFGHLEPWCGDTVEPVCTGNAVDNIRRKLELVGLEPIRLDKKQIDVPTDGNSVTIGRAFFRIGVIGSDKELDLWLKVELPNGCNFCTYHLTTESPFKK